MRRGIIVGAALGVAAAMSGMMMAGSDFPPPPQPGESQKRAKERERQRSVLADTQTNAPTEPLIETRQVRRARERREAKGAGR